MAGWKDEDSDVPEEFTAEQGMQQYEEIKKIQQENKLRIIREAKEHRRKKAQRITPQQPLSEEVGDGKVVSEPVNKFDIQGKSRQSHSDLVADNKDVSEPDKEFDSRRGMLPKEIVNLLAAQEKQVFLSDSDEEETENKHKPKKKKAKRSGIEPVILNNIPPAHCLENSLEFIKRRKMQVSRSGAVLNNSNQALRFLSRSGLLK